MKAAIINTGAEAPGRTMETFRSGVVALIGPPNAGKSTLLNNVLGEKVAIVSPKPQTTRNRITGILSDDDSQIVFLDTPGIHRNRGKLNKFMLDAAWDALNGADAVLIMLDAQLYTSKPHVLDKEFAPLVKRLTQTGLPLIIVANKVDRVRAKGDLLPFLARCGELCPGAEIMPVSARTGFGVDALVARVKELLPAGMPSYPEDQLSTLPLRFMASEIVREKLFLNLSQELPYNLAVEIDLWEEREADNLTCVGATIYTSRDSHKGIIIGKQGRTLKKVGQEARRELKELLGTKVHLELWVKVKQRWTEDGFFMTSLGLGQ
jgi:GTP-binding protein Era